MKKKTIIIIILLVLISILIIFSILTSRIKISLSPIQTTVTAEALDKSDYAIVKRMNGYIAKHYPGFKGVNPIIEEGYSIAIMDAGKYYDLKLTYQKDDKKIIFKNVTRDTEFGNEITENISFQTNQEEALNNFIKKQLSYYEIFEETDCKFISKMVKHEKNFEDTPKVYNTYYFVRCTKEVTSEKSKKVVVIHDFIVSESGSGYGHGPDDEYFPRRTFLDMEDYKKIKNIEMSERPQINSWVTSIH